MTGSPLEGASGPSGIAKDGLSPGEGVGAPKSVAGAPCPPSGHGGVRAARGGSHLHGAAGQARVHLGSGALLRQTGRGRTQRPRLRPLRGQHPLGDGYLLGPARQVGALREVQAMRRSATAPG